MKIIKHGSTYIKPQTIKCMCGCEFEIEDSDVFKKYLPAGDQWMYHVDCPECGHLHFVKRDN